MYSPSCPDCEGRGFVVVHFWAVPCKVCLANLQSNEHLTDKDLKNKSYMHQLAMAEQNDYYWFWIKSMVEQGHISPSKNTDGVRKRVRKKK